MNFTKIDQADLDSPRRELSNGGLLESVVALTVFSGIDFLSARIGRPIQLYAFLPFFTSFGENKHETVQVLARKILV